MSSALSFTFRPSLIPAYAQAEFLTRFCQLVLDYETLTSPVPEAPSAEQIPAPSAFVPVDGDTPVSKKPRKNAWADLTEEQRTERVAKMRAGRATKAAERKMSDDSLVPPQPPAEADSAPNNKLSPEEHKASVDRIMLLITGKKQRKNPWADLTPEQREARLAKMRAGREAKKAVAATGSA